MQVNEHKLYDCAIVGGGLAGLCLSIQLAKAGKSVVLLEKNKYPFHKVCGEYISMESWDFLESLLIDLTGMDLPKIDSVNISAHNGYKISSPLKMGGFGISRHRLDSKLAAQAKEDGVMLIENCNVFDVKLLSGTYSIETSQGTLQSKLVCGSYGKIEPAFIARSAERKKGNYIGVKYHVKTPFPSNLIELHNFKDGYCGISTVDNETVCICYLTTTENLNKNNNDIKQLEENVLYKNPHLKKYFSESEFLFDKPLAISQITFKKKQTYKTDILLLGDSAGAIAPLCGNGMSIAMRSSKISASFITEYLEGKISKNELINSYTKEWNKHFSFRIKAGYYLQNLFGRHSTTLLSLKVLNVFPAVVKKLISLTHGDKF